MVAAASLQEKTPTETWVKATWVEFTSLADDSQREDDGAIVRWLMKTF